MSSDLYKNEEVVSSPFPGINMIKVQNKELEEEIEKERIERERVEKERLEKEFQEKLEKSKKEKKFHHERTRSIDSTPSNKLLHEKLKNLESENERLKKRISILETSYHDNSVVDQKSKEMMIWLKSKISFLFYFVILFLFYFLFYFYFIFYFIFILFYFYFLFLFFILFYFIIFIFVFYLYFLKKKKNLDIAYCFKN